MVTVQHSSKFMGCKGGEFERRWFGSIHCWAQLASNVKGDNEEALDPDVREWLEAEKKEKVSSNQGLPRVVGR